MSAAADGPASEDLTLVQKLEVKVDKIKDCRKQADAKKLNVVERIKFIRGCLQQ